MAGVVERERSFWNSRGGAYEAVRNLIGRSIGAFSSYGELETIADRWATLVRTLDQTALALNADDPLIADLGRDREERPRQGVSYFGIEDASQALPVGEAECDVDQALHVRAILTLSWRVASSSAPKSMLNVKPKPSTSACVFHPSITSERRPSIM